MTEDPPQLEQEKLERYKTVFGDFCELLRVNPNIRFITYGIGNITGNPNGDGGGRKGFYHETGSNQLVRYDGPLTFLDRDVLDKHGQRLPNYQKQPIIFELSDRIISGFLENVRGDKTSSLYNDTRGGNRFFAGTEGMVGNSLYTSEQLGTLYEILEIQTQDPDTFIQMMEALCMKYIPRYYAELKRIEQKHLQGIFD